MTRVAVAVRAVARRGGGPLPLGVQVLSGGNREALAVAQAAGAQFIRCENFVYAHVADEGLLERAEAGALLRYRRQIGAEDIRIFTDIRKKHARHAITADLTIREWVQAAEFFGSDGVVVSGSATGAPTREEDVREAARASALPVLVGSGATPETLGGLLSYADGVIVGSTLKADGIWYNELDPGRCERLVQAAVEYRR